MLVRVSSPLYDRDNNLVITQITYLQIKIKKDESS